MVLRTKILVSYNPIDHHFLTQNILYWVLQNARNSFFFVEDMDLFVTLNVQHLKTFYLSQ
jgi:hypothetical protein